MSRSRRKTPVFGTATKATERRDKQLWHRRWRARERTAWARTLREGQADHVPVDYREVSDVWTMDKDGHFYWSRARRWKAAQQLAEGGGGDPERQRRLTVRRFLRWMAK